MTLTASDPHHFGPVQEVQDWLRAQFSGGSVLDVGPGHAPLKWATHAVDFVIPDKELLPPCVQFTQLDVAARPLPFPDKHFDFVYARHIVEDMFNPFPLLAEMSRVGKAGYVETPSPIAELTRGVDGGAPCYRGYHHHRFVVWESDGELRLVSKYPLVEYLRLDEGNLAGMLRSGPQLWNTYHLWDAELRVRHLQSPLDFDIPRDYPQLLAEACRESAASTKQFFAPIEARENIRRKAS